MTPCSPPISSEGIAMGSSHSRPQSLSSLRTSTSSALIDNDVETIDCATQMMADEFEASSALSSIEDRSYLSEETQMTENDEDDRQWAASRSKPGQAIPQLAEPLAASTLPGQTINAKKANTVLPQTTTLGASPTTETSKQSALPMRIPESSSQADGDGLPRSNKPDFPAPQKTSDLTTLNGPERYTAGQPQLDCEITRDNEQGVFVLKPTLEQWDEFPALLAFAVSKGALDDGCFKMVVPQGLHRPVPEAPARILKGHGYMPQKLKNGFWRVYTVPTEATFSPHGRRANTTDTPRQALARLKKLFGPGKRKRLTKVAYRADVPAWTPELRRRAGVPEKSTMYPLKGDMLEHTKVKIPGIHTPYVYQSAAAFGATFQLHDEDYKLISLNHLYVGRKIWLVNPSTAILDVERVCDRGERCAQFMRHRAEFIFPDKFEKMGVPCRIVDQRPGETMVILPDAYHQGFSTGYTLAEAKNYADAGWSIGRYQPCGEECRLNEAIPADMMAWLEEGEEVEDFCAQYERLDEVTDIEEEIAEDVASKIEPEKSNSAEDIANVVFQGDTASQVSPAEKRKREPEDDFGLLPEAIRVRQTRSHKEF